MSVATEEREDVEGIGSDEGDASSYPIDSVNVRTETRTVFETVRRINQGVYVMDPDFQRAFVWTPEQQSRLIQSVLMRIPLPVVYLAENPDGKVVVVDGLQRLTTFKRFLGGEFALVLGDKDELNGLSFDHLAPQLKNRIEDAQLIIYTIDAKVPEKARLDIFDRVNSGVPLSRQQMRNCLYNGPGTRWLRDAAESALFRQVTGHRLDARSMRDREVVNRFCSYALLGPEAHTRSIDEFLAAGIQRMNKLDAQALAELRARLDRALRNNAAVFGKHAFRKISRTSTALAPINLALFDVFAVLLADRDEAAVVAAADDLRAGLLDLLDDERFHSSISTATNTPERVRLRFDRVRALVTGVLDAH